VQFMQAPVIIDAFSVPPSLTARGMTAEVAANRMSDGLVELGHLAGSSKEGVTAIPKNQRVDFQIPDSGISIDSLVYYVRQFFHLYQTRISGEFLCATAECKPADMTLRVRILREKLEIIQMPPMGSQSEADYFRATALKVLGVLDPFMAAAVEVQTNPVAGLAQAERLVRQGDADAIWAYNLIGNTKMTLGDTDGAITAFQAALAIDPGFVIAESNLGNALAAKKDYAGAAKVFDTVARQHPDDRFLALGRYRLALDQGQTEEAIAQALKADAVDPGKAMYLSLAGQAAFGASDIPRAREFFDRALQVAPDDDLSVTLLGLIHQLAEEYDQAEQVLRRALDVAPQNVDFLTRHAQALGQLHRLDEALAQVDKALALAPQDASAQKVRASTLQGLGRYEDAMVQVQDMQRLTGETTDILLMRGQNLTGLNRKDEAKAAYDAVIAQEPGSANATMAKAYLALLGAAP